MTMIINLRGVECAKCGQPGYQHHTVSGLTFHLDGLIPPCRTQVPVTAPKVAGSRG